MCDYLKKVDSNYIERNEFRMFLKYIYISIIFEKLFSIIDDNDDQQISRDEFDKLYFIFDRLGLCALDFDEFDSDQSGYISLQELIDNVIIKLENIDIDNLKSSEINKELVKNIDQEDKNENNKINNEKIQENIDKQQENIDK